MTILNILPECLQSTSIWCYDNITSFTIRDCYIHNEAPDLVPRRDDLRLLHHGGGHSADPPRVPSLPSAAQSASHLPMQDRWETERHSHYCYLHTCNVTLMLSLLQVTWCAPSASPAWSGVPSVISSTDLVWQETFLRRNSWNILTDDADINILAVTQVTKTVES